MYFGRKEHLLFITSAKNVIRNWFDLPESEECQSIPSFQCISNGEYFLRDGLVALRKKFGCEMVQVPNNISNFLLACEEKVIRSIKN